MLGHGGPLEIAVFAMLNKLRVHMLMEENNIYRKILEIPAKLPTGTFEPVGKVLTLLYSLIGWNLTRCS